MNNSSDPWASYHNPFSPPSISETQLNKIKEGRFVDFFDLLPENQAAGISSQNDRPIIEIGEGSVLTYKEHGNSKKLKINSFHRWSTAWCLFAQAHLHFYPGDYFNLFTYHSLMVQHVNQYKFEAC